MRVGYMSSDNSIHVSTHSYIGSDQGTQLYADVISMLLSSSLLYHKSIFIPDDTVIQKVSTDTDT